MWSGTGPRYQHLAELIPQSRFQVTYSITENGKMYKRIKTLLNFPFTNAFYVYFFSLRPQEKKPPSSKHKLCNFFLFREPFWPSGHHFGLPDIGSTPESQYYRNRFFTIHSELEILARVQTTLWLKYYAKFGTC